MLSKIVAHRNLAQAILLGMLFAACLARFLFLVEPEFWIDEIISITVAQEGPLYCVPATLRFSAHPPSYYCQLSLWTLVSDSGAWLAANGVFWNFAALGAAYMVFRRKYSLQLSLAACLILALLPQFLYYAANVRMYSFLIPMALLVWLQTDKVFDASKKPLHSMVLRKSLMWRGLFQLLLGYAHAVGPLYAFVNAFYALVRAKEHAQASTRKIWFIFELGTGLLLLPVVINGSFRETQHATSTSMQDWAILLWNNISADSTQITGLWAIAGTGLLLGAIYFAVRRDARSKPIFWALFVFPIALFVVVSLVFKPIMSDRGLAVILPAFSLLLTVALSSVARTAALKAGLFAAVFAMLVWQSYNFMDGYNKPNDYRGVAARLEASLVAGDQLFIYQGATAWGTLRRLKGEKWGSALAIQAPPNARWQQLETQLGSELCALLKICAMRHSLDHKGIEIVFFHSEMTLSAGASRVWLLHNGAQTIESQIDALRRDGYVWQSDSNFSGEILKLFIKEALSGDS